MLPLFSCHPVDQGCRGELILCSSGQWNWRTLLNTWPQSPTLQYVAVACCFFLCHLAVLQRVWSQHPSYCPSSIRWLPFSFCNQQESKYELLVDLNTRVYWRTSEVRAAMQYDCFRLSHVPNTFLCSKHLNASFVWSWFSFPFERTLLSRKLRQKISRKSSQLHAV